MQTGIPATQSLDGISKAARSAQGKKGGVVRLAYLTALAPKLGDNLASTINPGGGEGTLKMGVDEVLSFPILLGLTALAPFANQRTKGRLALPLRPCRHASRCLQLAFPRGRRGKDVHLRAAL
jgi:hypothetical protein